MQEAFPTPSVCYTAPAQGLGSLGVAKKSLKLLIMKHLYSYMRHWDKLLHVIVDLGAFSLSLLSANAGLAAENIHMCPKINGSGGNARWMCFLFRGEARWAS